MRATIPVASIPLAGIDLGFRVRPRAVPPIAPKPPDPPTPQRVQSPDGSPRSVSPWSARRLAALGRRGPGGSGRRPTFTPEWATAFLTAIRAGNFRTTAARLTGKSPYTVRYWLDVGRRSAIEPFATFSAQVEQAQAEFEARAVSLITAASVLTPALALRYLGIRHRERFRP